MLLCIQEHMNLVCLGGPVNSRSATFVPAGRPYKARDMLCPPAVAGHSVIYTHEPELRLAAETSCCCVSLQLTSQSWAASRSSSAARADLHGRLFFMNLPATYQAKQANGSTAPLAKSWWQRGTSAVTIRCSMSPPAFFRGLRAF